MQVRADNFEEFLQDFVKRLVSAVCVAVDFEFTGCSLEPEEDRYTDTVAERLSRMCRISEQYEIIQFGLTIVSMDRATKVWNFVSYNISVAPSKVGSVLEPSTKKWLMEKGFDFYTCIWKGVPYINKEDCSTASKHSHPAGLLRLWEALRNADKPLVIHGALDIFFMLTAFERHRLPHDSPRELAKLVLKGKDESGCFSNVYDTSYLADVAGLHSLGLEKLHDEAKNVVVKNRRVQFTFEGSAWTYRNESRPHDAGYDSLVTAQLYVYLLILSGTTPLPGNRLWLYRSTEYIDLNRIAGDEKLGMSLFDDNRVTLMVARFSKPQDPNALSRITRVSGTRYRRMEDLHKRPATKEDILVIINGVGSVAMEIRNMLYKAIPHVDEWQEFSDWYIQKLSEIKSPQNATFEQKLSEIEEVSFTSRDIDLVHRMTKAVVVRPSYGSRQYQLILVPHEKHSRLGVGGHTGPAEAENVLDGVGI